MRIEYKVLWIENDEEYVLDHEGEIYKYLDDLGFRLNLVRAAHGDPDILPKNDFQYDLILMDYNLDSGSETGDKLIEAIRKSKVIIETLFYSSDSAGLEKARKNLSGVERISYHALRRGLMDKIKRLIDITVRKVQDINNVRGLVIAEAVDLEVKMTEIIQDYFKIKGNKKINNELIRETMATSKSLSKSTIKKMKKYSHDKVLDFITEFFTSHSMEATISKLIKEVSSSLKVSSNKSDKKKHTQLLKLEAKLKTIRKEVFDLRNIMAHAKESLTNRKNKVLVSKNKKMRVVINDKECIKIRKGLKRHNENLISLAKLFS